MAVVSQKFVDSLTTQYRKFAQFALTNLVDPCLKPPATFVYYGYNATAIKEGTNSRAFFLPADMMLPVVLRNACLCFGKAPDESSDYELQHERIMHVSAFYDLVHLFWVGYFQFINALNVRDSSELHKFLSEARLLIKIPRTANMQNKTYINHQNKDNVLVAFVGVYAMGLLMTEDKTISTRFRVKAIKLWRDIDTGFHFAKFDNWYGDGSYLNILPSSWDPDHRPDKLYTKAEIQCNPSVKEIFGDPFSDIEKLPDGLELLLRDHQRELVQVAEAFLRLNIFACQGNIVKLLFAAADAGMEARGTIFGEKASYRNKGFVSAEDVRLDYRTESDLKKMIADLRHENTRLKERHEAKIRALLQIHAGIFGNFDYKQYYSILGFSPLQSYNNINILLEVHYRKLSLEYYLDKNDSQTKLKLLSEAYEVFHNYDKYHEYFHECEVRIKDEIEKHLPEFL